MKDYLGNEILIAERCIVCGNKYFEDRFVRHIKGTKIGISETLDSKIVRFTYSSRIIMLKNIRDNSDIND
jgi:hypothetical protein